MDERESIDDDPEARTGAARVPCPNCCRLAIVIERRDGLLYYRCELCESVGATPEPEAAD